MSSIDAAKPRRETNKRSMNFGPPPKIGESRHYTTQSAPLRHSNDGSVGASGNRKSNWSSGNVEAAGDERRRAGAEARGDDRTVRTRRSDCVRPSDTRLESIDDSPLEQVQRSASFSSTVVGGGGEDQTWTIRTVIAGSSRAIVRAMGLGNAIASIVTRIRQNLNPRHATEGWKGRDGCAGGVALRQDDDSTTDRAFLNLGFLDKVPLFLSALFGIGTDADVNIWCYSHEFMT
ncbi:hypothetical protein AXG93_131s1440 [Marchantia polymorpha subsp. ruderalis]|uniref:Uncharacterized protein n=1 Tax=Marchantia polymorpha subsp. ruderalis TaxID=1480154 RepID=A0A176W043_MARPO|nr:hypothetical protein AXG93_131s1440 [Marchantia polymorpha subsp. ruderalis]